MVELFGNSEDPDQMLHSSASDMDLHCFPVTRLRVSSLQWVNTYTVILSLPLIKEGQLSVSGERMCTILVNRLED